MPRKSTTTPAKKTSTSTYKRTAVSGKGAYKAEKAPRYYRKYKKMQSSADNETVGEKIGRTLGGWAQKAIKAITGFGDYQLPNYELQKNSILDEAGSPPAVHNAGHEFIVRHREYVKDITAGSLESAGASNFKIEKYSINPGMIDTFPWLASVAQNFEQYEIQGMLFEFKSMFSDAVVSNVTGGSLGSVIMATDYNAAAPPFVNKVTMENYEYAQSAKPSISMCHPVECARHLSVLNELYIRNNITSLVNQDIKTYDFGNFYIASQGIPTGPNPPVIGELWITYQVRLIKPKIGIDYIDSGFARWTPPDVIETPVGGEVFPNFSSWTRDSKSNIDVKIVNSSAITIPKYNTQRRYLVSYVASDPTNSVAQAAAVGYFPSGSLTLSECTLVTGLLPVPFMVTKVTGSVVTSQTSCMFYLDVPALGNGLPNAQVDFPTGIGASLDMDFELVVNAVPL